MLLLTCLAFFGRGDPDFTIEWIEFWFQGRSINPGFVTRKDIRKKVGVLSGIFLDFEANLTPEFSIHWIEFLFPKGVFNIS